MWELEQKIQELLEEYLESSGAVRVKASELGLDARCGYVHVSIEENWIAVEGNTKFIDYYGGFEYIDNYAKKTIDRYTFYEGECERIEACLEFYLENNKDQGAA